MPGRVINWNRVRFDQLVRAYEAAVSERKTSFKVVLTGEHFPAEFDVSFAKHTIEYLSRDFAAAPDQPRRSYNEGEEGQ